MGIELYFGAVVLLGCFAVFAIVVGVSNDAVNFLSPSIGCGVASRRTVMVIAGLGILLGVTLSSGMMEVARKGIFHPRFFTMPDLLFISFAVMLATVLLLDLFNTYGLPTSTTVAIVFELLGAAVAISLLKMMQAGKHFSLLGDYINTSQAMMIIFGILLSVVVAFIFGAIVQFLSRLLFTFDFGKRLARYGAVWGGIAMAAITYFILVKGAKGSAVIPADTAAWLKDNALLVYMIIFPVSALILQVMLFFKVNIFKPIILIGTFALAMAFAANDLVNFIGVPMAGYHAYRVAAASAEPLGVTMGALGDKVPAELHLLLLAGLTMVVTLVVSKKARGVTQTTIDLCAQDEGEERFGSSFLSRFVVRMARNSGELLKLLLPRSLQSWITGRFDPKHYSAEIDDENRPKFDLLRASVNLMVASAVISYATSHKLPLSTTYVTFMVAMGSSFADRAWGLESAVYRVTGVLTIIGGWFLTALMAFTAAAAFATVIFYFKGYGVAFLLSLTALIIWKNHHHHAARSKSSEMDKVFNLKKVSNLHGTLQTTCEHISQLLREIRASLDATLEALFQGNTYLLGLEKGKTKRIQRWTNIITANIFKSMRLMQKEDLHVTYMYGQTIRRLQKFADGHRDVVMRCHFHVSNHHTGLLKEQVEELRVVKGLQGELLAEVAKIICSRRKTSVKKVVALEKKLRALAKGYHKEQLKRIRDDSSKTRLSILFYAIVGNAMMLSKQNLKLLEIFKRSFGEAEEAADFDLD